ncbi:MAG TPA: hypothetical protein VFJ16_22090 [Longimicrobium sp.]|nr:hypothetical protein [Longimicrobium sp.]
MDAVTAKVRKLRAEYEREGFEVIVRPGPECFPFDIGDFAHHPPAMLARKGARNDVIELREEVRATGSVADCAGDRRALPDWHFYLAGCGDVVPDEAPGIQGDPPAWPQLERTATDTLRAAALLAAWTRLLALWTVLEGVLRRIAADDAIPLDLLPPDTLIRVTDEHRLIPRDSVVPLAAAHEVHRLVRHGFDASDDEIREAVRAVSAWLPALFPASVKRAA